MRCHCGEKLEEGQLSPEARHLHHHLTEIERKLDLIIQGVALVSDQSADITNLAQKIDDDIAALAGEIKSEIDAAVAAAQAANPAVDLSAVSAAVGRLDALVTANAPAPAPAPEPAPAEAPPADAPPADVPPSAETSPTA